VAWRGEGRKTRLGWVLGWLEIGEWRTGGKGTRSDGDDRWICGLSSLWSK